jgi:2-keto-4-pentenoate hydratase
MNPADILEAARRAARRPAALPQASLPADFAAAYRIQAELARRSGGTGGWKIAALVGEQQAKLGVDRPIAARILRPYVHQSPARLAASRFVQPAYECEFAFRLGRDLPPRAKPYDTAEIEAAIAALHPAIEIADSRVGAGAPALLVLADCFGNGAFIHGPGRSDWRSFDLATHAMTLRIDGNEAARGSGAAVPGGPVAALLALANHQPAEGEGLKVGQYVTTGSCTGMTPMKAGQVAVADFGSLGNVRVEIGK